MRDLSDERGGDPLFARSSDAVCRRCLHAYADHRHHRPGGGRVRSDCGTCGCPSFAPWWKVWVRRNSFRNA